MKIAQYGLKGDALGSNKLLNKMVNRSSYRKSCIEALKHTLRINKELSSNQSFLQLNRVLSQLVYSIASTINYLDNKSGVEFEEVLFVDSIYISLNRYFLIDVFIALELEIIKILESNNIQAVCNMGCKYDAMINELELALADRSDYVQRYRATINKLKKFAKKKPEFADYFECLMTNVQEVGDSFIKDSHILINALRIVRNKLSHSETRLTESECSTLAQSPLAKMVGENRLLQINILFCPIIAKNVYKFLDVAKSRCNIKSA